MDIINYINNKNIPVSTINNYKRKNNKIIKKSVIEHKKYFFKKLIYTSFSYNEIIKLLIYLNKLSKKSQNNKIHKNITINVCLFVYLKGAIKYYDWGNSGSNSIVYNFTNAGTFPNISPDSDSTTTLKTYAELWFGTHQSGHTTIISPECKNFLGEKGELLVEWLNKNTNINEIPYIFKILSVKKSLSIQAHPDKLLAQKLFKYFPDKYKDANDKPEMVIALTQFEVLCDFRCITEIINFLKTVPELTGVLGKEYIDNFILLINLFENNVIKQRDCLKQLYTKLMITDVQIINVYLQNLYNRLTLLKNCPEGTIDNLIIRLYNQYPLDIGIFSVYMLNYIILQPGQSLFIGPNRPHAYILGECIEIMNSSDNVVRAGLTQKFKDINILTNMLTYESIYPTITNGQEISNNIILYNPGINYFKIIHIFFNKNNETAVIKQNMYPYIVLILKGKCNISINNSNILLKFGDAICVTYGQQVTFSSIGNEYTQIYIATNDF